VKGKPQSRNDAMNDRSAQSDQGSGFELLEHTGDAKLRVWAGTPGGLFVCAAEGMMNYLFGERLATTRPEQTERIQIDAPDREALLVDWLSELLYRATSGHHAYVDFRVIEISERRLVASARIASAEASDEIKAVTHHELSIRRRNGGWEANVVFDI
jgi:SHS2 domain-containing protein